MNKELANYLFETEALKIADPGQPFWYTSGKIGPFFINTHFLYGSANEADVLLQEIEQLADRPEEMPPRIAALCLRQFEQNLIYNAVIKMAYRMLEDIAAKVDFISGGARRDFFFSLPLAELLTKPHLSCYKDGRSYYSLPGEPAVEILSKQDSPIDNQKGLHIADIVTVASSFFRLWIPQIERAGATMSHAAAVLDRGQGGAVLLAEAGVSLNTLGTTNAEFFQAAVDMEQINSRQKEMCVAFLQDPDKYMADFLSDNPGFISAELAKGGKSAERAQLALDLGYARK
ncbi:MAG TPA: hypothetical protein GXZ59_02745 [Clostridiaceae bacterium]|nr:hypothetical protein [Clostridiaceae bacterium]